MSREEVQRRLLALGRSQNWLARGIRKDPGHVSRVLRGIVTSAIVLRRIEAFLVKAEARAVEESCQSPIQRPNSNQHAARQNRK